MTTENSSAQEVYSLMIPTVNSNLLLPNANVAEIVPFSNVELYPENPGRPRWYLGHLHWRGQEIPLVSLDVIRGEQDPQANKRSRVAVAHSLNMNRDLPYIAIVVQGIPRLSHVTSDNIRVLEEAVSEAEHVRVQVESNTASIPNLDRLEEMILAAKDAA